MSDGQGATPDPPPGWAAEQPPPFAGPDASPWAAPGASPDPEAPARAERQDAPPSQAPPTGPPAPGHGPPSPGYGPPPPGYGPPPGPGHGPPGGYGYRPPPVLRPGIIPLRPLGLGDILDGTIKLIRSNPKALLGLSAIVAAVGAIPTAVGQAISFGYLGDVFADPGSAAAAEPPVAALASQYGGLLLSLVIQFVAVTLLTGVLTRILGRAVFGGTLSAGEAWRLTRPRAGALLGLVLLTGLVILAPMAVIVPLLLLAAGTSGDPTGLVIATILLLLLYLPYTFFFNTRFAFAAPAVVLEGRGVIEAMRRSWRLVSGGFWRTFGILLLTMLLAGVIGGVFSTIFSVAGAFVALLGGGSVGAIVGAAVLLTIGGTLAATITYPIQAGVNGLLYADRRMRTEAFDLVLQTAALEQQRQGWVHSSADELWHPDHAAATPPSGDPTP